MSLQRIIVLGAAVMGLVGTVLPWVGFGNAELGAMMERTQGLSNAALGTQADPAPYLCAAGFFVALLVSLLGRRADRFHLGQAAFAALCGLGPAGFCIVLIYDYAQARNGVLLGAGDGADAIAALMLRQTTLGVGVYVTLAAGLAVAMASLTMLATAPAGASLTASLPVGFQHSQIPAPVGEPPAAKDRRILGIGVLGIGAIVGIGALVEHFAWGVRGSGRSRPTDRAVEGTQPIIKDARPAGEPQTIRLDTCARYSNAESSLRTAGIRAYLAKVTEQPVSDVTEQWANEVALRVTNACAEQPGGKGVDELTQEILYRYYHIEARRPVGQKQDGEDTQAKAADINRQGGTLLEQGKLEEAVTLFDEAIVIDPHLTGAMTNRGYALLRLNRLDEAETSAAQALEASSASRIRASARVLIGKIAEARGDVRRARTQYEGALREQHGYPQAQEALAALPLVGDVEGRPEQPSEKEHEGTPKPVDEQTQAKPKGWVDPFGSP